MIYFVAPTLIEQPTWGGEHIAKTKKLNKVLSSKNLKLGQSYELSAESHIVPAEDVEKIKEEKLPYFLQLVGEKEPKLQNKLKNLKPINSFDTKELFGMKRIPDLLVKFTQAKGNSFQLHTGSNNSSYKKKAESWYFFEKGIATLGIKPNANLQLYKSSCEEIYKKTQLLSAEVKAKKKTIELARKELNEFIEMSHPINFVNLVNIKKDGIVNNYLGGIHHSWEEDNNLIPNGNILYEVQQDVPDNESTIRSFDKGKILDDGSYRKLDIDAYFENMDKTGIYNDPTRLIKSKIILKETSSYSLKKIFETPYYHMDELIIHTTYEVDNLGFRHLFVRSGAGTIKTENEKITLKAGWSYIVSNDIEEIKITKKKGTEDDLVILSTYFPPKEY